MPHSNKIGRKGENLAVDFLKDKGYEILETNWFYDHKEIDIIAKHNNTIIFVEVKTRTTGFFGEPYEFVNVKKQEFLIEAATNYIFENNIDLPVRFDIISIIIKGDKIKLEYLKDAF